MNTKRLRCQKKNLKKKKTQKKKYLLGQDLLRFVFPITAMNEFLAEQSIFIGGVKYHKETTRCGAF